MFRECSWVMILISRIREEQRCGEHSPPILRHRVRRGAKCTSINKRRTGFVRAQSLSDDFHLSGEKVMYLERDARHKPGKPVISR